MAMHYTFLFLYIAATLHLHAVLNQLLLYTCRVGASQTTCVFLLYLIVAKMETKAQVAFRPRRKCQQCGQMLS